MKELTKTQIEKLSQKDLLDYAINLYQNTPLEVSEISSLCNVTRTRLYNNIAKRGLQPNRQNSLIKNALAAAKLDAELEVKTLTEEIGVLKYFLSLEEEKVAEGEKTIAELRHRLNPKVKTSRIASGNLKMVKTKKVQ